jgi:cobalt-precorrin-5B (C1)-methyltransferase
VWYTEALGEISGLRRGYSTGSCAQAAAKAAALVLCTGELPTTVSIRLPETRFEYSGLKIELPVHQARRTQTGAEALVRKDSGDDSDITNGALIGARLEFFPASRDRAADNSGAERVIIDGAEGVGRITREGVAGKLGTAAINPVPRRMIEAELLALLPTDTACRVLIFVPDGERLAQQTWNPRIGITGGISIIGTKGVVEPKSTEAFKESIDTVIESYRAREVRDYYLTPGYVGEAFLSARGVPYDQIVTLGDHVGYGLQAAARAEAARLVMVGHIGKLSKLAAGIFDTHWSTGDARLEVVAAHAAAVGASAELVRTILSLGTAEEAAQLVSEHSLDAAYHSICRRINERIGILLKREVKVIPEISTALLSLDGHLLAADPPEVFEQL